ncbi:MAG: cytochrome c oxidase subunit [Gaiellaceae bacterium]|jgi:heme/copper-type cytochrome/quinol oxidase subunit 3|nr:cytochrome c oxidase subunit [Gaiellaceae bacterium]
MSAADVAAVARARRGPSTAWWGMAMFVATEATLFAIMTASYFYLRFKNLQWPPHGIPEPKVALPLAMLALLLATSVPVHLAARAGRAGRLAAVRAFLLLAFLGQAAYLAVSIHEYAADLKRFTPQTHAYGSIYFTLLGADHAHVGIGLLFSLWLLAKLARGMTLYRLNALQAIAFYWYAVNVLTVVVTLTILSPAL